MSLLDTIHDGLARVLPQKSATTPAQTGGISNTGGHGMVEDDMIVSKPAILFYIGQIFFDFLAMACFASVASFQAHWKVGPSGLTGFAVFVSVAGIVLSVFMLFIPVVYEKYDKFVRLARALKETRVAFILAGTGASVSLLISFIVTISAWTEPGCKNPDNDPNASKGDAFKSGLSGWCSTKKAGAVFFWFSFGFWMATLGLLIMEWRSGKLSAPRDPPFVPPSVHDEEGYAYGPGGGGGEEEDTAYSSIPPISRHGSTYDDAAAAQAGSPFADANRFRDSDASGRTGGGIPAGRPSMDAYGAFSDPAPSGFGRAPGGYSPGGFTAAEPTAYSPSGGYTEPTAYSPSAGYNEPTPGYTTSAFSEPTPSAYTAPTSLPASPPPPAPAVSRTMQYADPYAAVRATIGQQQQATVSTPPSYEGYASGFR